MPMVGAKTSIHHYMPLRWDYPFPLPFTPTLVAHSCTRRAMPLHPRHPLLLLGIVSRGLVFRFRGLRGLRGVRVVFLRS